MARKLFEGVKLEEPDSDRKDYKPPEERALAHELSNRFLLKKEDMELRSREEFESEVKTLESLIKKAGDNLKPQSVINSLTGMLKDDKSDEIFWGTEYLSALVQAFYNLDYTNEFVIDIKGWPKKEKFYRVGLHLKGRPDKPLILKLKGKFYECGTEAEYCDFTIQKRIELCAQGAKNCRFTFHDWVGVKCGYGAKDCEFTFHEEAVAYGAWAEDCIFNLMPDVKILGYHAEKSKGNILRRMSKKGEWQRIW